MLTSVVSGVSCLFSMCDIAKQLRRLMERHQNLEIDSPVEFYNLEHWGSKDKAADRVHVLAGPAAQMVSLCGMALACVCL